MNNLCSAVLQALYGRTLVTAESCTGGGIGAALTAIKGSSEVYKGGIICYTNQVKHQLLQVDTELLERFGAVSAPVASAMAQGVRRVMDADVSVSVTGLAGPGGDQYGNPVGTVYIGYCDHKQTLVQHHMFSGDREQVRRQAVEAALNMILENCKH